MTDAQKIAAAREALDYALTWPDHKDFARLYSGAEKAFAILNSAAPSAPIPSASKK